MGRNVKKIRELTIYLGIFLLFYRRAFNSGWDWFPTLIGVSFLFLDGQARGRTETTDWWGGRGDTCIRRAILRKNNYRRNGSAGWISGKYLFFFALSNAKTQYKSLSNNRLEMARLGKGASQVRSKVWNRWVGLIQDPYKDWTPVKLRSQWRYLTSPPSLSKSL